MESPRRESFNPYQVSPAGLKSQDQLNSAASNQNTMAIVSLILGMLGIAGVFICGVTVFLSPVAVVTGHLAMSNLRGSQNSEGYGMAMAGLITGYLGSLLLIIGILLIVFVVAVGEF